MSENHIHEHDHHDGDKMTDEQFMAADDMDAGNKSLAKALSISFSVLKIIMAILVVLFFVSGIFTVGPDERAMVLHFGKIRGQTMDQRVLGPGLHWAIPYPVQEVIKFPGKGTVSQVEIDSFWYNEKRAESSRYGSLNPIYDGYCLTRNDTVADLKNSGNDYNIVHLKLRLLYRVDGCEDFLKNIKVSTPPPGRNYIDVIDESVRPVLTAMGKEAIVTTIARFSIDEAIKNDSRISNQARLNLQDKLDLINSGIKIDAVQITHITWPKQVDADFIASIKASNEADKIVRQAKGSAQSRLNEAGGEEIFDAMMDPNLSSEQKDNILANSSGKVREKIARAMAYRTKVVESAKADADYLKSLLPEYRKRPKLVLQRIYQDAVQEVLTNAQETIVAQPSATAKNKEFRVMINRDPMIGREKKEQ